MHRFLQWLLNLTFLFWFIPWQGKEFFPELFDTWYIQWPSTGLTIAFGSIGLFLAYREFFTHAESRRKYAEICCGFVILLGVQILIILSVYFTVSSIRNTLTELERDNEIHVLMLKTAYAEETPPENSENIARTYYRMTGIIIPAKTPTGLALITPTAEDVSEWQQSVTHKAQIKNELDIIDFQIVQLPFIAGAYIGALILVFLLGTIFLAFRKQKMNNSVETSS
jgi:hypothetical protein